MHTKVWILLNLFCWLGSLEPQVQIKQSFVRAFFCVYIKFFGDTAIGKILAKLSKK